MSNLKIRIRNHFENGFSFYFILALVVISGIVIGALVIKAIDNDIISRLVKYSSPYFYSLSRGNISNVDILKLSIFLNIIFAFFSYLIALLNLAFIIPLLIFIRGLQFGLLVGYMIINFGFKGFWISLFGLYPQYLIYIPCIISLGALTMTISLKYPMNSGTKLMKLKRMNLRDYTIFVFINIVFLMLGSLYEGLISPLFLKLIAF